MTRVDQHRTNPSQAVSNFKGRWDTVFGWPSTAISTWLNGGLFGGIGNATRASGGDEVSYTGYKSYTFTGNGSFVTAKGGYADIFLVGGGGAAADSTIHGTGSERLPGGGGAGGVRTVTGVEDSIILAASTTYTVVVGAAGAYSSSSWSGGNGYYSRFSGTDVDVEVGGGGGGGNLNPPTLPTLSGGGAGTGAGGGSGVEPVWIRSNPGWGAGRTGGTYGGDGATGYYSSGDTCGGHGGGAKSHTPVSGIGAFSDPTVTDSATPNAVHGTYNTYGPGPTSPEPFGYPYACGGCSMGHISSSFVGGVPALTFRLADGVSGRISGGYGGSSTPANKTPNQNTGGGGGASYGGTGGAGSAGVVVVRVAV